jgi:hypothetical protein
MARTRRVRVWYGEGEGVLFEAGRELPSASQKFQKSGTFRIHVTETLSGCPFFGLCGSNGMCV